MDRAKTRGPKKVDDENAAAVRKAEELAKRKKRRGQRAAANPRSLRVFKSLLFTNAALNPREFFKDRKKAKEEENKRIEAEQQAAFSSSGATRSKNDLSKRVAEELRAERGEITGIAGGFGDDDFDNFHGETQDDNGAHKGDHKDPQSLQHTANQRTGLDHMFCLIEKNPIISNPPENRFIARDILLNNGAGILGGIRLKDAISAAKTLIDVDDIQRSKHDALSGSDEEPDGYAVFQCVSVDRIRNSRGDARRKTGAKRSREPKDDDQKILYEKDTHSSVVALSTADEASTVNAKDAASLLHDKKVEQEAGVLNILNLLGQRLAATRTSDSQSLATLKASTQSSVQTSRNNASLTAHPRSETEPSPNVSSEDRTSTRRAVEKYTEQIMQNHISSLSRKMNSDATLMTKTTASLAASSSFHHRQLDAYMGTLYEFNHQLFTSLTLNDMLFQLSRLGNDTAAHVVNFNETQISKRVGLLNKEAEALKMEELLEEIKRQGADDFQQSQIRAEEDKQRALIAEIASLLPNRYEKHENFSSELVVEATRETQQAPSSSRAEAAQKDHTYPSLRLNTKNLREHNEQKAPSANTTALDRQPKVQIKGETIDYHELERLYREQHKSDGAFSSEHAEGFIDEEELLIEYEQKGNGHHPSASRFEEDEDPEAFMMQMMMGFGGAAAPKTERSSHPSVASVGLPSTRRVLTFPDEINELANDSSAVEAANSNESFVVQGTLDSTQEASAFID